MRKALIFLATVVMLESLTACSSDEPPASEKSGAAQGTSESATTITMADGSIQNDSAEKTEEWLLIQKDSREYTYKYRYNRNGIRIGEDVIPLIPGNIHESTIYRKEFNDHEALTRLQRFTITFLDHDGILEFNKFLHSADNDELYEFEYSPSGNVLIKKEISDGKEYFYEYTYDTAGNLLTEDKSIQGYTLSTTKNEYKDNICVRKWVRDEQLGREWTYIYDENGDTISTDMLSDDGLTYSHAEYKNGIITSLEEKQYPNGAAITEFYDERGLCVKKLISGGQDDGAVDVYEREFDPNGNVLMEKETLSGHTTVYNGVFTIVYEYDDQSRIISTEKTTHYDDFEGDTTEKEYMVYTDDEDGHSYMVEHTVNNIALEHEYEYQYTTGAHYLPLSRYLEQQDEISGTYCLDGGEDMLMVYPTLKENCYFAILDHGNVYSEYLLFDAGEFFYLSETLPDELFSREENTFELDENSIICYYEVGATGELFYDKYVKVGE